MGEEKNENDLSKKLRCLLKRLILFLFINLKLINNPLVEILILSI